MGGVIGGVGAILPAAFDPPQTSTLTAEDVGAQTASSDISFPAFSPLPAEVSGAVAFAAEFPSHGSTAENGNTAVSNKPPVTTGDDGAAVVAATSALRAVAVKRRSSSSAPTTTARAEEELEELRVSALLSLLARLPPICPPGRLPTALPSLLLLAVRVLGAVSGKSIGSTTTSSGIIVAGSGSDPAKGLEASRLETQAAVEFVRSCVSEVSRHGDNPQEQEASAGDVPLSSSEIDGVVAEARSGDEARPNNTGDSAEPPSGEKTAAAAAAEMAESATEGDNDDDDDDWGDEDFQGAEDDFQGAEDAVPPAADDPAADAAPAAAVPVEDGVDETEAAVVEVGTGDDEPSAAEGEVAAEQTAESGEAEEDKGARDTEEGEGETPPSQEDGEDVGDASGAEESKDDGDLEDPKETDEGESQETTPGGQTAAIATTATPPPSTAEKPVGDSEREIGTHAGAEKGKEEEVVETPVESEDVEDDASSQETPAAAASAAGEASSHAEGSPAAVPENEEAIIANGTIENNDNSVKVATTSPPPPAVADALILLLAAGRAVNELLTYLLDRQTSEKSLAIGAAAEAWGAIALAVPPQDAEGLAGPLRSALTAPIDKCSISTRLALLHAVAVTVGGDEGVVRGQTEGVAAATLLRVLAPHALAALRLEVDRAAGSEGASVRAAGGSASGEEPREACLLEGVHVAQLAFKVLFPGVFCVFGFLAFWLDRELWRPPRFPK